MLRRIFAWVLLVLFIVLIINIFVFQLYITESVILYGLMIAMFFFIRIFDRQGNWYGTDYPKDSSDNDFDQTNEGQDEEIEGEGKAIDDESGREQNTGKRE